MTEPEPVWCVRDRHNVELSEGWHATASGNAPLSRRTSVRCVCPQYVWGELYSGGDLHYRAEIRLPTCLECQGILLQRHHRAQRKAGKNPEPKQGVLF